MAYRRGENLEQMTLFPQTLDEYVPTDHPVRAYVAFVDTLDFDELGIKIEDSKVGNSEYYPKTMLTLLLYGYSYGIKSSRKLERAVHDNISFVWLMKKLTPDHKTISEFRRRNKAAIKNTIKLCARLCLKLDLIEGNILFIDGTKMRANAGRRRNYTVEWYKEQEKELDSRIDKLLKECEDIDQAEAGAGSMVKMRKDLAAAGRLKEEVRKAVEEIKNAGAKTVNGKDRTINLTDPDSRLMKSVQGSHASYNVQNVVDDKHGLIVTTEATSDASDVKQFARQVEQAEETLEKQCNVASGDSGYANTEELEKVYEKGTQVVVPSRRQAKRTPAKQFDKSEFKYDSESNSYSCPEGERLIYSGKKAKGSKLVYRITNKDICHSCKHYGICTESKKGRKIIRLAKEKTKEKIERFYETPEAQEIYSRRKERAEHPFGHIKRNLGLTNFSLRGRLGAQAEISICATCFNVVRMITIFGGVAGFIERMKQQIV